ncbi:metallophosphoesterase [Haladaptatus sp. YSMS36]|uniref:metallophosphoesterase family protein n=1 Tax=Haladaptatus sp. YSMS36 TaxID=3033384 RepID=UPI0023E7D81D|nr:metallophosphoesterase [Haladaptatus sp. YSMS36]
MGTQRILVMGDNHGDTESLSRVCDETVGEEFDFIIHVGDITNAKYADEPNAGTTQLEAINPYFEALENRGTLLYIWGNRDGYGDSVNREPLTSGTLLERNSTQTIDGQRFSTNPQDVDSDTILLTHGFSTELIDHFTGRAYFSGHVHTGRYKDRCLNSAFLYRDGMHGAEPLIGGYFVITVKDALPFSVEFRNLDRLKQIICPFHNERGVLFQPDYTECQFCYYDGKFAKEVAMSAYYGLTSSTDRDRVAEDELIEYAKTLFETPPAGLETGIRDHLNNIHPLDSLTRLDDGTITGR